MSEYIDRNMAEQALIKEAALILKKMPYITIADPMDRMIKIVQDIPAADVAPVEWHAIEDCLPDVHLTRKICERVGVLVVVSDGGVRRTRFRSYERADVRGKTVCRWKYPRGRISHEHITHWAYLPEPPKEETNELDKR